MNEAQRQFYLRQCGVELWYSRMPMPGAAPSINFEFPTELAEPVPSDDEQLPTARPEVPRSSPARHRRERVIPPEQKSSLHKIVTEAMPSATAPSVSEPEVATLPQPVVQRSRSTQWTLNLRWAETERLVIIGSLGKDVAPELQQQLLLNLAAALGETIGNGDEVRELAWPVFANGSVPGNDDAGLVQVLGRMLRSSFSKTWLCLGADVIKLVAALDEARSGGGESGPRIGFDYDLGALAVSGQRKRELWVRLQGSVLLGESPG